MESPSAEEETVRRKRRVRATSPRAKKAVADKAPVSSRASRAKKTVDKKLTPETKVEKSVDSKTTGSRRAPTKIASGKASKKTKRKQVAIVIVLILVGVGASAMVGITDPGAIDVNTTIEARNDRMRDSGQDSSQVVSVPVQNTTGQADGGLIGLGIGSQPVAPTPASELATSSATTSDSVATSTEQVATSSTKTSEEDVTADEEQTDTASSSEVGV